MLKIHNVQKPIKTTGMHKAEKYDIMRKRPTETHLRQLEKAVRISRQGN